MFAFTEEVIYPKDYKSLRRIEEYKEYYQVKHNICKEFNPKLIVEIGIRAGYSAWSFLQACPNAKYIGFDANNGLHGGKGGEDKSYFNWAKQLLEKYDVELNEVDTQRVPSLNLFDVDFFHVDGDHSIDGVKHDLDLAWECISQNGVILIDDVDYLPDVKEGTWQWIEKVREDIFFEYRKSLRGELLIRKVK